MEDLIKREDAIKAVNFKFNADLMDRIDAMLMTSAVAQITKNLANIPSAEKQGEWIKDKGQDVLLKAFIDKGEEWRVCSVCGTGHKIGERTNGHYHAYFHNYCPNCGAKMFAKDIDVPYKIASDQRDYDGTYEPTYNEQDGSM